MAGVATVVVVVMLLVVVVVVVVGGQVVIARGRVATWMMRRCTRYRVVSRLV
jgi:hypothetical protein